MATAPLFTRIVPAASRETTMVLSRSSPATVNTPVAAEKVEVTDSKRRSSSASSASRGRGGFRTVARRLPLPRIHFQTGLRSNMRYLFLEKRTTGAENNGAREAEAPAASAGQGQAGEGIG